jgi:hypothetical protein
VGLTKADVQFTAPMAIKETVLTVLISLRIGRPDLSSVVYLLLRGWRNESDFHGGILRNRMALSIIFRWRLASEYATEPGMGVIAYSDASRHRP